LRSDWAAIEIDRVAIAQRLQINRVAIEQRLQIDYVVNAQRFAEQMSII
jgi:hypothetical protein